MANVAVVVLDTLRYDTFRAQFDWLPGREYTRAYATSHWTAPVHGSLFTGRYASEIGVHGQSPSLDCPDVVLAEALQEAGYRTRMYSANPQMAQYYDGWDRGFDEFVSYWSFDAYDDDAFDWGTCFEDLDPSGYRSYLRAVGRCLRSDCATLPSLRQGYELYSRSDADGGARSLLDRLRATDFGDDEFLFVNLMETHTPYHPAEPDGEPVVVVAADAFADEPVDFEAIRRAYDASAAHLSEMYRDIFAELSAAFDYVITLSDHGELLGEHGMVNHTFGLDPELVHVPLVVSGDGLDGSDDRVVSLLDVHRTVADLAGVDVDSRGQNLLADPDPVDRLFEYHGLLPFHEQQFERKGVPEAAYRAREEPLVGFVAANGAYAYETHTRGFRSIGTFPDDPRERLDELVADLDERAVDDTDVGVPESTRDRLEDLGYA
jgi:arylsulfatase